jgi:hypothetical protein
MPDCRHPELPKLPLLGTTKEVWLGRQAVRERKRINKSKWTTENSEWATGS